MLLWFAGMSFLAVWLVFRDPAIDHRLVMVGAVLPDVIDAPTGGVWVMHSVVASVALLVVVMLATIGRRRLRRQLLALPIGTFLHLVFDAGWSNTHAFWWPFAGTDFADVALPSVERGIVVDIVLEVIGAVVLVWAYRRFRLAEPPRRAAFLRTGRLGRDLVT
jgi:hypothetical protein